MNTENYNSLVLCIHWCSLLIHPGTRKQQVANVISKAALYGNANLHDKKRVVLEAHWSRQVSFIFLTRREWREQGEEGEAAQVVVGLRRY